MKYIKLLRIDRETEFRGNDQIKHGESAYPRDAWVELQYNKRESKPNVGVLPHMTGAKPGASVKDYNNAMEMMPTMAAMSKLVRQTSTQSMFAGQDNKTFEEESEKS